MTFITAKDTYLGVIETDAAKNQAADQAIEQVMDPENDEVSDELIEQAGKALANRHFFVLMPWEDNDSFTISGSSIAHFEENDDFTRGTSLTAFLIPVSISEMNDACWATDDDMSVTEVAKAMRDAGFMWSEKEQRETDARLESKVSFADEIAKVYAPAAPKAAVKASKKPKAKASKKPKM